MPADPTGEQERVWLFVSQFVAGAVLQPVIPPCALTPWESQGSFRA
jgi:hypothetical protein